MSAGQQLQAIRSLIDDLQSAADALEAGESTDAGDRIEASTAFSGQIEADASPDADADGLQGIVWASGTHDLWVNGEPTRVHVPEDTIPDTFDRLQDRMEAEAVKIGFDHPDSDSVAAQTALGEIGKARDFTHDSLEAREAITMRDSEFTNSKAIEAAEAGSFEDMGFSIVGDIALATDDDGQPMKRDDGALEVAATDIHRVDVVADQAVEGAKHGNLPELAEAAVAAGRMAASPGSSTEGFARTLRAAAGSIDEGGTGDSHMTDDGIPTDPENLEAAKNALNQASDTVEAKEEQIEDLEAKASDLEDQADHFRQIAASQGVDPDADDFEPQDVVDAFSSDIRAEIADLEAALPQYDTEDIEARQGELEGKPIRELEAMVGDRWRQFGRSKAKRDELSVAVAAEESVGSVESASGGDGSTDADEAARDVLRARELQEAQANGVSPSEYVSENYGIEASEYDSEHQLQAKLSGGAN